MLPPKGRPASRVCHQSHSGLRRVPSWAKEPQTGECRLDVFQNPHVKRTSAKIKNAAYANYKSTMCYWPFRPGLGIKHAMVTRASTGSVSRSAGRPLANRLGDIVPNGTCGLS